MEIYAYCHYRECYNVYSLSRHPKTGQLGWKFEDSLFHIPPGAIFIKDLLDRVNLLKNSTDVLRFFKDGDLECKSTPTV